MVGNVWEWTNDFWSVHHSQNFSVKPVSFIFKHISIDELNYTNQFVYFRVVLQMEKKK